MYRLFSPPRNSTLGSDSMKQISVGFSPFWFECKSTLLHKLASSGKWKCELAASGAKKVNTLCNFAWTKAWRDGWIFVFVCGLPRRKKVSTPAWRNMKIIDFCQKNMNDFPHLLKLTINHQLMSKTAFLCQKHGWPAPIFTLFGPCWRNDPKCA